MSFDEMYDEMLHDEFRSRGKHAAPEAVAEEHEGPRGLSRFRTAAAVGAGGLACAAVGAFLGGLGGYFTVNPAAAHSLASSTAQEQPLAAAVNQAYRSSPSLSGSAAVAAASFSSLSGSLTQGIAPFQALTYDPPMNLPVTTLSLATFGLPGTGGTTGAPGGGAGGAAGAGTGAGTGSGAAARPRVISASAASSTT